MIILETFHNNIRFFFLKEEIFLNTWMTYEGAYKVWINTIQIHKCLLNIQITSEFVKILMTLHKFYHAFRQLTIVSAAV